MVTNSVKSGILEDDMSQQDQVSKDSIKKRIMCSIALFIFSCPLLAQTGTGAATATATDKLKESLSVKDFGAVGNGIADDTVAIQVAVVAAADRKAEVFIPFGVYKISAPISVYSGTKIRGVGGMYNKFSGSVLKSEASTIFDIPANRWDIDIEDLGLLGHHDESGWTAGIYGISLHGTYPNSSYRMKFSNLRIAGFERGISVVGNGNWQCDGIQVLHSFFVINKNGIYISGARNADYWVVDNCGFGFPPADGTAINLQNAGFMWVRSTTAGGGLANNSAFIRFGAPNDQLLVTGCQAESLTYFLYIEASASVTSGLPITVRDSVIDCIVKIDRQSNFISSGNIYSVNPEISGNDVRISSMDDSFSSGSTWAITGSNSYVQTQINTLGPNKLSTIEPSRDNSYTLGSASHRWNGIFTNALTIGSTGSAVNSMNWNATTSVADGGLITHGVGSAPTAVFCTPSVAGEMCSVTAIGVATFTVALKKHDGTAGTSQTIYWMALK